MPVAMKSVGASASAGDRTGHGTGLDVWFGVRAVVTPNRMPQYVYFVARKHVLLYIQLLYIHTIDKHYTRNVVNYVSTKYTIHIVHRHYTDTDYNTQFT